MEIKMKLAEAINLNAILKTIIDDDANKKMDALFKFRLLGIMKSLESNVKNFETIRNEKIKEYGTTDDEGNVKIDQNDIELLKKFSDSLNAVLLSNITISIEKLKVKDIFDKGVSSEYLVGLYGIIEE